MGLQPPLEFKRRYAKLWLLAEAQLPSITLEPNMPFSMMIVPKYLIQSQHPSPGSAPWTSSLASSHEF
jgi:hypothetical protein